MRVVNLENIVRGEYEENTQREDFLPSERAAIKEALEPYERAAAKERQGTRTDLELVEKFSTSSKKRSGEVRALDKVADYLGISRPTLVKARVVVKVAKQEPEKYGPLLAVALQTMLLVLQCHHLAAGGSNQTSNATEDHKRAVITMNHPTLRQPWGSTYFALPTGSWSKSGPSGCSLVVAQWSRSCMRRMALILNPRLSSISLSISLIRQ